MPDTTRTVDRPLAPAAAPAPRLEASLDPRARRTVLVWRLRRSVARRIVRL